MSSFNCSPVSVENEQAIKLLEVAFKAGRIGIFINSDNLPVQAEEFVVVEADKGIDIGKVIMKGATYGEHTLDDQAKKIVRVATEEDLLKFNKNRELEDEAVRDCKEKIIEHRLSMNLVDAEYQLDHSKLTFYFTAEQRVDFRKLVRDLASQYRTRIELRQIGVRDAARHVGGYGSCGCQLCCTLFLRKFENITTQYIKDQLIPMSPSRLTGICGRLKCCLAYERDFYLEELEKYPTVGEKISTPSGAGIVEKVDIFNSVIYFRNEENDIIRMNVGDLIESH
ncbi:MAG: regulatory iron-sulfur-containing complex subunit RicT [Calditrichia bacterium]